ncbi:MAG: SRPBCC family protein [Gemmataceae bacterium]
MKRRELQTSVWIPQPVDEVFAFFSDAFNLDRITPPWLHFAVLTESPIPMKPGQLIDYRLRWRWIPMKWRTEIVAWEPPRFFIDQQIHGPYRLWHHEHTFVQENGGTRMMDKVTYAVPGWIFEPFLNKFLVRPDVERIFLYREDRIQQIFSDR